MYNSYDTDLVNKYNFFSIVDNIENLWSSRDLTLAGRIRIFKSLAISKAVYISTMKNTPSKFISILNEIQQKFIWNKKRPKLKHSIIIGSYEEGGYKDVDIATQFSALKMIWIWRSLDNNYHPWKLIPTKLFGPLGGVTFFHSNLKLADSSLRLVKTLSPFYQELVNLWANISQQNPTAFSEICNQTLWNNSFITTLGKPIFYKDFIDKNMLRIADLLTDSDNFLSWQMTRQEYNLGNKDIMNWLSLIVSVPMSWKAEIRNYFSAIEDTCTPCTHLIPQPKVSLLPDMSVKATYKILIGPLVKAPTSQKSWEKLLCRQDLDWASIYMIPRMVTVESKLRIFKYKVLNNILYLNDRLYKMGIVQTPLCSLCKQEKETGIHLLSQCHVTR